LEFENVEEGNKDGPTAEVDVKPHKRPSKRSRLSKFPILGGSLANPNFNDLLTSISFKPSETVLNHDEEAKGK
jgi:hypothetical protein